MTWWWWGAVPAAWPRPRAPGWRGPPRFWCWSGRTGWGHSQPVRPRRLWPGAVPGGPHRAGVCPAGPGGGPVCRGGPDDRSHGHRTDPGPNPHGSYPTGASDLPGGGRWCWPLAAGSVPGGHRHPRHPAGGGVYGGDSPESYEHQESSGGPAGGGPGLRGHRSHHGPADDPGGGQGPVRGGTAARPRRAGAQRAPVPGRLWHPAASPVHGDGDRWPGPAGRGGAVPGGRTGPPVPGHGTAGGL